MTADVVQCQACLALAKSGQTTLHHHVGDVVQRSGQHQQNFLHFQAPDTGVDGAVWVAGLVQKFAGGVRQVARWIHAPHGHTRVGGDAR